MPLVRGTASWESVTVPQRSEFALRFFFVSAFLLGLAGCVFELLLRLAPPAVNRGPAQFSRAFLASTLLLVAGTFALSRAHGFVRRERQRPFRRSLVGALIAGTLFVGVQTYALACLIRQQVPEEIQTGAVAFVAVAAALHAMHFIVALLCLVFVTVQAYADRYDHEYFWGVTVCSWFWHALGIVWFVVLGVMAIVRTYSP